MAKRQIRGKRGKQLYLNKLFNKGMLYTSSEMREGVVKTISNYDISPTGDSARPRSAFSIVQPENSNMSFSKYFYPVKFSQTPDQHYIEFLNTVSEQDFINYRLGDTFEGSIISPSIKMYSRNQNAMNDIKYEECINPDNGNYMSSPKITIKSESTGNYGNAYYPQVIDGVQGGWGTPYCSVSNITDNADTEGDIFYQKLLGLAKPESFFSDLTYSDYSPENCVFEVIDGDTVHIHETNNSPSGDTTSKYRLLGINAPESTNNVVEEWGLYAKDVLQALFDFRLYDLSFKVRIVKDPNADLDEMTPPRFLRWIFIKNGDRYYNLSEVMVAVGLAKVAYIYNNYLFTQSLINAQSSAKSSQFNMWSSTRTDPYYFYGENVVDISKLKNEESDEVHIQVVKIQSESQVTHKLKNVIDEVQFEYIDYLDAVAFLGAIVLNGSIKYKGLLLLKARTDNDTQINFDLIEAPNNGQGEIPSIIEAVTTGYNLYNEQFLNMNNDTEISPVNILGIIPSDTSENNNLVTQVTPGSKVRLHGVINQGPFLGGAFSSTNIKFNGSVKITKTYTIDTWIQEGDAPVKINSEERVVVLEDEINNAKTYASFTVPDESKIKEQEELKLPEDHTVVVVSTTNSVLNINIYEPILVQGSVISDNFSSNDKIVFDDKLEFRLDKLTSSTGSQLHLKVNNNLGNLNKSVDDVTINNQITFISRWEKTKNEGFWELISEYENYKLENERVELLPDKTNYIDYVVEDTDNISLKYSLIPAIKLYDKYVINEFMVMYQVLPNLSIGKEWKMVSDTELAQNIRIRNATRIGLYNRQLFLYGRGLGAHTIQFTPFEKVWYFPFPYYNISIDEPIIHIHPHKDSLFIFGQYNIYILSGGVSILEMTLFKIYENLSIKTTDISTVNSIGNNVMFMNNQMGYIIVPNKYTNRPEDIQVYRLTESISNLLINPEGFIKARLHFKDTSLENIIPAQSITSSFHTYISDNVVNIIVSYEMDIAGSKKHLVVWCKFDQGNNRWTLYDTRIFDKIIGSYICEPQLGYQFITLKYGADSIPKAYFGITIDRTLPEGFAYGKCDLDLTEIKEVETFIDSGFLSVDTMNDKRFKDLIFEFNNIGGSELSLIPNFFVDGIPTLVVDDSALIIVEDGAIEWGESKEIPTSMVFGSEYGFKLSDSTFGTSERLRVRFPVWGKGRMPQFTLRITAKDDYELLNFSLIYKEKNIERR